MKKKFNLFRISEARNILFGIAMLWIAVFHSSLKFEWFSNCGIGIIGRFLNYAFDAIKSAGNMGVEIFVFLSGVGLYFSFSKDENLKDYYKKRAIRILPESFIIAIIWYSINFNNVGKFIYSIFFLEIFISGLRDFWFISFILIAYAIFPLIYKLYKKYGLKAFIFSLIIIIIFNAVFELLLNSYFQKIEIILTRIPIFLIGIYFAKFIKEKKDISAIYVYLSPIIFLGVWFLIYLYSINKITIAYTIIRYLGIFFALSFIMIVAAIKSKLNLKVLYRCLEWFGKYSIEIYLIFEKVNGKMHRVIPSVDPINLVYTLITFSIALILSIILKYLTELVIKAFFKKKQKVDA